MHTITLSEFKAKYQILLRAVHDTREPIRITRNSKPFVEIHPIPLDAAKKERLRSERDARDLELINRFAEELNAEAVDRLKDQTDIFDLASQQRVKKKSRRRQR